MTIMSLKPINKENSFKYINIIIIIIKPVTR